MSGSHSSGCAEKARVGAPGLGGGQRHTHPLLRQPVAKNLLLAIAGIEENQEILVFRGTVLASQENRQFGSSSNQPSSSSY